MWALLAISTIAHAEEWVLLSSFTQAKDGHEIHVSVSKIHSSDQVQSGKFRIRDITDGTGSTFIVVVPNSTCLANKGPFGRYDQNGDLMQKYSYDPNSLTVIHTIAAAMCEGYKKVRSL